jgi:hypothetical protein
VVILKPSGHLGPDTAVLHGAPPFDLGPVTLYLSTTLCMGEMAECKVLII